MKFSFIIPVYNSEDYLDECIQSVIQQSYTEFEIILVDDGSERLCAEKCDKWAEKDNRISVVHQKNSGLSSARNRGIGLASGEYIVFLDSDDFWISRELLNIIHLRLSKMSADVLSLNYCKVYNDSVIDKAYFFDIDDMPTNTVGVKSLEYMVDNGLWVACAWNKVVKKSLFKENQLNFVKGITSEDIDWSTRLALIANQFDFIKVPVIGYRQRKGSISKTITPIRIADLTENIKVSEKILSEDYNKGQLLRPYIAYQVGTLVYNIGYMQSKSERVKAIKELSPLLPILQYSTNFKVVLIRRVIRIFGINFTIGLINMNNYIKSHMKGRG